MNRYKKYKPTGIEWIGNIPEHWEVKKFKMLFKFSRGLSITKENLQDEGIPCVNYGEIHSRLGIEFNPKKDYLKCVSKDYLKSSPNSLLQKGDFIFADTSEDIEGSGNFTFLNSDIETFAGYHTIIAKPTDKNNNKYAAYLFDSIDFRHQIRSLVNGTKVYSITQSILKNTSVLLPTIKERNSIANYLDAKTKQIDKLITDKHRLIELMKEKRTAIINEAVSGEGKYWERKKLKYVANINFETLSEKCDSELPIKYVDIGSVDENGNIKTVIDYVFSEAPSRARRIVRKGDTILSTVRTYLKSIAFIDEQSDKFICSTGFAVIRPKEELNEKFLFLICRSKSFINTVIAYSKGVSYPSIDSEDLKNIEVEYPSLKTQLSIVQQVEIASKPIYDTIAKIEKEIELIKDYRAALISEAVTGKIKVA